MSQPQHDQTYYLQLFPNDRPLRAGGRTGNIYSHVLAAEGQEGGCLIEFPDDPATQDDPVFFSYSALERLEGEALEAAYQRTSAAKMTSMILTTFTHAGGVGKTSIVLNVGYRLSELGYRVLLIDLDPQANLTTWLGVYDADIEETVYHLAVDNAALPEPRRVHGLDLIPSHIDLAVAEGRLRDTMTGVMRLRRALESRREDWDVVLIDSPPSLGQLAGLGALAADKLMVPLPMKTKGLDALNGINRQMPEYAESRPDLTIGLYIPTMFGLSRAEDADFHSALVERGFGPMTSPVPQRESIWNRAATEGKPVILLDQKHKVAEDVRRLTNEIINILHLPAPEVQA